MNTHFEVGQQAQLCGDSGNNVGVSLEVQNAEEMCDTAYLLEKTIVHTSLSNRRAHVTYRSFVSRPISVTSSPSSPFEV